MSGHGEVAGLVEELRAASDAGQIDLRFAGTADQPDHLPALLNHIEILGTQLATEREITANLVWAIEQLQSEKCSQILDDGSCIRCGAAPRDATGICATCVDEHAETPPTVREALERAEWWLSSHKDGRKMAEVCRSALAAPTPSPVEARADGVREAIRAIIDDALGSAIPEPWEVAEHATSRILAALESAPAELRGEP